MSKIMPSLNRKIKFAEHVTRFLHFREKLQKYKFEEFEVTQSSTSALLLIYIVASIFTFISGWFSWKVNPSILSAISLGVALFCPCGLGMVLLICRILANNYHQNRFYSKESLLKWIIMLESLWVLGGGIAYSFTILVIVSNGQCDQDDFFMAQGCNLDATQLPLDNAMISLIIPAMFSTILKGAKWEFVCLTFILNLGVLFYCCIKYEFTNSLLSTVMFAPFCMVLMYENQRQNIAVFLLTQSQQNLLEENERLADETHANEMRHMIGNVAHDLKTVSGI